MGISGLLPLLKEIQIPCNVSDFKGKRLAVDAYVWLHKGAFGCAEELMKGKKTTRFVDYAMFRVRMLRYHGITPYVVFDGGPLPAKLVTENSRAQSRADHLARAQAFEAQGRSKDARDAYTKCLDITPEMAFQLIKALRAECVDYVVAPFEADAQLCFLEREGYVDGIITEDSDLLVFGCQQVIFKLEKDGSCVSINRSRLASVRDLPMHGWTDVQFRRMAYAQMLSGCDYLPSIPGIGLKKAHRMLRRFKTVEKLLQAIRLDGSHNIPPDYAIKFSQAELAFIYQRVFDPSLRQLVPLNALPEEGLQASDEKWIGLDIENDVACGIACGDLHPATREPIEDLWPDFRPMPRVDLSKTTVHGDIAAMRRKGPMDAFITRAKKSRPAPVARHIGTFGNGPTRLSDLPTSIHRAFEPTKPGEDSLPTMTTVSKFFGEKPAHCLLAKESPQPQCEPHWDDGDDIESQSKQSIRSPTPEDVGSPSSVLSCIGQTPSRPVNAHNGSAFTSPCSVYSTPPHSSPHLVDGSSKDLAARPELISPTCASPAIRGRLFTPSSQMTNLRSSVQVECGASDITQPQNLDHRLIPLQSIIQMPPWSPSPTSKNRSPVIEDSSYSISVDNNATPTVARTAKRRAAPDADDIVAEQRQREHAAVVAAGWRQKYALHSAIPPTPSSGPRQRMAVEKSNSKAKRGSWPLMSLSAATPRILATRPINVPLDSWTPTRSTVVPKGEKGAVVTKVLDQRNSTLLGSSESWSKLERFRYIRSKETQPE